MKKSKLRILAVERDRILITTTSRARDVMLLLHGAKVEIEKKSGFLDLKKDIQNLTDALKVLGVDAPFPILE